MSDATVDDAGSLTALVNRLGSELGDSNAVVLVISDRPDVDAEQIVLLARLWKALGLRQVELHVNSIGDAADRKAHRDKLVAYFERHAGALDQHARGALACSVSSLSASPDTNSRSARRAHGRRSSTSAIW